MNLSLACVKKKYCCIMLTEMISFSTILLHLQSRHVVTEFSDHIFGLVDLREDHSHGGVAVSDNMYSYMEKKFQSAKEDHRPKVAQR
eukprot:12446036-Ditylum_brightwellii.AAC.1